MCPSTCRLSRPHRLEHAPPMDAGARALRRRRRERGDHRPTCARSPRRASARSPHAQRPRLGAHPARVPHPRSRDQRRPGRAPRHQRRDHAAAPQHARDLRGVRARHDRRAPSRRACRSPRTWASRRWSATARLCRRSRDEAAHRRFGRGRDRAPDVRTCVGWRAPDCDRRACKRDGHRRQERKDGSLGGEGCPPDPSQSGVRRSPCRRDAGAATLPSSRASSSTAWPRRSKGAAHDRRRRGRRSRVRWTRFFCAASWSAWGADAG